jgi:hypothetical protein
LPYQLSRLVAGPLLRAYGRPRLLGGAGVPASGPAILASNHLARLSRQEYVHMYASARKAQLTEAAAPAPRPDLT